MSRKTTPLASTLLRLLPVMAASVTACSTNSPADQSLADKAGFEQIVYAVRQTTTGTGDNLTVDVASGMGQVMDYGRYDPGARIEVRNLRTGAVVNLLDGARYKTADVEGMDLSFDATKIVFSMMLDPNDHYHVYTANIAKGTDPNNPYGIQALTSGLQDDIGPIWLAGDRIAFVTNQMYGEMGTRADEYNHTRRATQVAIMSEVGGDSARVLCSQNLSNVFNLFAMQSGQVGFSRWEHLENVNDSKLFAMNPDCTQIIALAGQHGKPANSLVQVTETGTMNVFIAVATDRERTIQAGALVKVDARVAGAAAGDTRHDEERASYAVLTGAVPLGSDPSPIGRYRSPHMLPDGRLLVSWADGPVNDTNELAETPPDFGIYIYDPATLQNQLVYNAPGTWELYAQPVAPRPEPPLGINKETSTDATNPMLIGSIDVSQTSLFSLHGETVSGAEFADATPMDQALKSAVKVRIIEGFSTEAAPNVTMFGLTMAEGAAILGEAPVLADGSWRADVPPYIPMHLQTVDEYELAIRSQTTWIQGMPGENRVCGGCHESRTAPNAPTVQQQTLSTTQVQQFLKPIADRTEYPWQLVAGQGTLGSTSEEIQSILTAKCAQCHNGTTDGDVPQEHYSVTMTDQDTGKTSTYQIARLDLTATPVTVTYDRKTATYPMSYVSIFYPSALSMEMGDGAKVTGTVPPMWGVPSDARHSALIEKINITSAIDGTKTAWPLNVAFSDPNIRGGVRTMHPDDVGVTLTRDERTALIRAFDMGGQFYSRDNSGYQPASSTLPAYPSYPTTN